MFSVALRYLCRISLCSFLLFCHYFVTSLRRKIKPPNEEKETMVTDLRRQTL